MDQAAGDDRGRKEAKEVKEGREGRPVPARGLVLFVPALLLGGLCLVTSGCVLFESSGSFSDSSGSVSDSSGSSSDSSRSSSRGQDSAYREDVRAFAAAHARAEGSPDGLRLGLSEVALARGVSDWEALTETFEAVGAGLAEAGLGEDAIVEFEHALARPGTPERVALRRGYLTAQR